MANETQPTQERIDGRQMIALVIGQYNAGINADGLHEILTIHDATQQLLESRTMGNNGSFRIDNAGFLATTANGEFIRRYLGGYIDNGEMVPKLRVDEDGKLRTFGSMRVSETDLDFDLVSTSDHDGALKATFQWFREPTESMEPEDTLPIYEQAPSVLSPREKVLLRASIAVGAAAVAVFSLGFKLGLTGGGEKVIDPATGETTTQLTDTQELGNNLMGGAAIVLATEALTLAILGRREEARKQQATAIAN